MDAVNELKGDLDNVHNNVGDRGYLYSEVGTSDYIALYDEDATDESFYLISTTTEFKTLVTELSNWQPTLPKVETVEIDGMVYEIGKVYEFSDSGEAWFVETLISVDEESNYPFEIERDWYKYCREFKSRNNIGTITPAPTKLIDGEAYTFDCQGETRIGFKLGEFFKIDKYTKFSIEYCTNITHLTASK